jgi:hypothetical protein
VLSYLVNAPVAVRWNVPPSTPPAYVIGLVAHARKVSPCTRLCAIGVGHTGPDSTCCTHWPVDGLEALDRRYSRE